MNLFNHLRALYTPHRVPVVVVSYAPVPILRQLGLNCHTESDGTDYCAFLLESRESHGVPSPCDHSCMVCVCVCVCVGVRACVRACVRVCVTNSYANVVRHNQHFNYRSCTG